MPVLSDWRADNAERMRAGVASEGLGGRRCLVIDEPKAKSELSTSRRLQAPTRHRCVGVPPGSESDPPKQHHHASCSNPCSAL